MSAFPGEVGIADRLEILDLYARQSHAIDGGDARGWAETFTEDGRIEFPSFGLITSGHAALEEFASSSNGSARERGEQLRHWTTNHVFRREDDVSIAVTAYLVIFLSDRAGSRVDRSLVIHDRLASAEDGWRFASRIAVRDAPLPTAGDAE
jgi:hypothetical protein